MKNNNSTQTTSSTPNLTYLEKEKVIEVQISGTNKVFQYLNVPPRVWKEYKTYIDSGAPSGMFLNEVIKKFYDCREVSINNL